MISQWTGHGSKQIRFMCSDQININTPVEFIQCFWCNQRRCAMSPTGRHTEFNPIFKLTIANPPTGGLTKNLKLPASTYCPLVNK